MRWYPTHKAIANVLNKLGIDPRERFDEHDQDAEYTSCRTEELPRYFALYTSGTVDDDDKRVLCCFLLETLNDCVQSGKAHALQSDVLTVLFDDVRLHADELAYWMNTDGATEDEQWPIAKALRSFTSPKASG